MAFGSIDAIHSIFAGNGDAVLAVLAFDGNPVFAAQADGSIFPFDGDAIFAIDADTGFPVFAINADMARCPRLAVFPVLAVQGQCPGHQVICQLEGDFAVSGFGNNLIGRAAEGNCFAELVAALGVVVALVFQGYTLNNFQSIHGQVIVMAGSIGVIGILIHYRDTAVGRFYGSPASIGNLFHIPDIGAVVVTGCSVSVAQAAAHVGDLVSCHRNGGLVDDDITLAVFPGFFNLQTVAIYGSITGLYAGEAFQFLGQADFQFAVGGFVRSFRGNHADVAI